jgi:uncharacterized membrane protein YgdD (TMEM256/DUF423 family)
MFRHTRLAHVALTAAGAYAVTGVLELAHDQPPVFAVTLDYVIEAAFVLALVASVAVLVQIARARLSGPGAVAGWTLAAAGNAALATAALATAITGREALDPLFPLGFLAIVAGYVTLAVVDLRRRLVPPRAGLVLLVGFIATAITDNLVTGGGTLVLATTWAALSRLISTPHTARQSHQREAVAA